MGEEQAEGDEAQVEHDVLQVDHSLHEALEMGEEAELGHGLGHRARAGIVHPAQDPEAEEQPEGQGAGHDLVAGEGGHEEAEGDETAAHEEEGEHARGHRLPLRRRGRVVPQEREVQEAGRDHERVEEDRAQELAQDDLHGGDGGGLEELDRALPLLLREEAHGQHGRDEEGHHRHVVEHAGDDPVVEAQLGPAAHLRLASLDATPS